jgi:hypothetical protein
MGVIGAEVTHDKYTAFLFGIVIFFIFLYLLIFNRKCLNLDRHSKWYSLLIFSVLTSLELALTRSGDIENIFGPPNNIFFVPSPRHQVVFFLPIICLYVLGIAYVKASTKNENSDLKTNFLNKKTINIFLVGVLFTLLISSTMIHFPYGWRVGEDIKRRNEIGTYILTTYKIQSDENIKRYLYPIPDVVRERAKFLEMNKLNVFNKPLINISDLMPLESDTLYWIDTINSKVISQQTIIIINSSKEETITIQGWAVDKIAKNTASAVFLTIDERINIPTYYGLDRLDVANAYKEPNFRFSGFIATFSSSILEKGEHTISIKIVAKNGNGYYQSEQTIHFMVE